jgi:hypothetical protein
MKRVNLIPLALICTMLLTGFTRSVAQDVEIEINLPYSGNFNEWFITFYDRNSDAVYYFETDDGTFDSDILGTIPAGSYNVEFNCPYFPWEGFDINIYGPNVDKTKIVNDAVTIYDVPIEDGTVIRIDEGY